MFEIIIGILLGVLTFCIVKVLRKKRKRGV